MVAGADGEGVGGGVTTGGVTTWGAMKAMLWVRMVGFAPIDAVIVYVAAAVEPRVMAHVPSVPGGQEVADPVTPAGIAKSTGTPATGVWVSSRTVTVRV